MQKSLNRRDFIKSVVLGAAAIAIPHQILGSDKLLFEIKVESSDIPDYKKVGTIRELRAHFRKEIIPTMPDKLRELYCGTAMFALDLSNDPKLLSKIFEKIKGEKNFENVIKNRNYQEGQEDITFFNPVYDKYYFSNAVYEYSLKGNFNNLEIKLYFDTDPKFTKVTGMNFYINNLNLNENRENHPDRIFIGDNRGDLYREYGSQGKYLNIIHLQGGGVDVGGLRTLLTSALNKQELIKKDFELIRKYIGK